MRLCAIIFISISNVSIALAWPTQLNLLDTQQKSKLYETISPDEAKLYSLDNYESTVGMHGIVHYSYSESITCPNGFNDTDRYYLSLYVEGSKIKDVIMYQSFGCHED